MRILKTLVLTGLLASAAALPARADKIDLTGTLRDFHSDGKDFENDYNGQYPLITGMVKAAIGADHKPVLNVPTGSVSVNVKTTGSNNITSVKLTFADATTYTYSSLNTKNGTYVVPTASAGKAITSVGVKLNTSTVYTIADNTAHSNTGDSGLITATFTQGAIAIPLQWRVTSNASFNQWFNNVSSVNLSLPFTIELDNGASTPGGVYSYARSTTSGQSFFPLDGLGFGNEGRNHNFSFTFELHTRFTYTDPATRTNRLTFNFSGDDDVWVFINGKLAIDLGGVHAEQFQNIDVDTLASSLGLVAGKNYDFDFFYCERHTTQSNMTIQTTLQFLPPLYD